MPGIYGYRKRSASDAFLNDMTKTMMFDRAFIKDITFSDQLIEASRMHIGQVGMQKTPLSCDSVHLWIEGECYNWLDTSQKCSIPASNFQSLILAAYKRNRLNEVLKRIDGYFCAAIYDSSKKKILLFSDRYGMRLLYYYKHNGDFAWASEVKGLLGLSFVDRTMDSTSISCCIDLGYLLGDHTLHQHIKLIKPASIVEYAIDSRSFTQQYYWKWSEIQQQELGFDEAVDQLGELMLNAVKKRFNPQEKIGVSLSGGLDSRMLLAAVNKLYPDYQGYACTFGISNCLDIEIAKQVMEKVNWKHQLFYFTNENWFESRLKKIWQTDGMLNILHMHGSEFLPVIKESININFNGFAGDAIAGSSFMNVGNLNKRMNEKIARGFYKQYFGLAEINDSFYDTQKVLPNLIANRVRRFTAMGTVNALQLIEQRKPFLDNELFEFIHSLSDDYRYDNKIYSTALLRTFPEFFSKIPWQKTGRIIGQRPNLYQNLVDLGQRVLSKLGMLGINKGYTNYKNWLKEENIANKLGLLLKRSSSAYQDFIENDFEKDYLLPHLQGRADHCEKILGAITLEIYLRKVFGKKWENDFE